MGSLEPLQLKTVAPPWAVPLTDGQHALIEYRVAVAGFCLVAVLTRMWSARSEVGPRYRSAVPASVAVLTVAFLSSLLLAFELLGGYHRVHGVWLPDADTIGTRTARYVDWTVSVPLLVVEGVAVSAVIGRAAFLAKLIGAAAAVLMIVLGFVGAVVVGEGTDLHALLWLGVASSVCFLGVYAVVITVVLRSLPVLPAAARTPLTAAAVLLLVVWFVSPIVHGMQGVVTGGAWTVTEHLLLSGADVAAKVVFGLLLLRVARVRTAADVLAGEDVHPESIWIDQLRQSDGTTRPVRSDP
ncbi:MAG: bacteriorhodopsin [Acidobacteria bacterium]|nr:bacteriorhodopsin [Acidobacteriota bacterium]